MTDGRRVIKIAHCLNIIDRFNPIHVHVNRVSDGRTVIKIAHRLNTIVDSDVIAVLHAGQVTYLYFYVCAYV